jgi:hypothetical protein
VNHPKPRATGPEPRVCSPGLRLADQGVQLADADGDGRTDLLVTTVTMAGYFPLRFGGLWDRHSFQRYQRAPSFNLEDPDVRLVDLDGDGVTDAIRSGARLECFFNNPKEGWKGTRRVERMALDQFENINFSDPRVKWADLSGDGLQDIVLVYDGSIEYWPNLGYGNWGKRIHMRHSPRFPYGYDPKRILIGDVDGDGLADLVYVDDTKVKLWINQSGNGWSEPIVIKGTPSVTDMDSVRLADMLGNGVSGILWSANAGQLSRQSMFFLDFTGGIKPYLLNEMDNHIGAVTRVAYAPSTRFYLEDQKQPATRWKTPLPFPVQVVAHVEAIDDISGGKLTTEYRYHHGYWDGAEREFRGFGRVDHRDTEAFENFNSGGLHPKRPSASIERKAFSPPTETRTWFHQGPIGDEFGEWEETDFSNEYWPGDLQVLFRPPSMTDLLKGLPRRVKRDALRTLRGSILRSELYALDGTDRADSPYTVTESLHGVCEVIENKGATILVCAAELLPSSARDDEGSMRIFFPHALAQRTTQWERGDDPMTQFSFSDDYDDYGQSRLQAVVAVPRWRKHNFAEVAASSIPTDDPVQPKNYLATLTRTEYAQRDDTMGYMVNRVARSTMYEILNDGSMALLALKQAVFSDPGNEATQQLIGQSVNFYDGDAFQGLPLFSIGAYGALVRTETLVLTEKILHDAYTSGATVTTPAEEPPYLAPSGAPPWTSEYPPEFRSQMPALAGYIFRPGGPDLIAARGYFVVTDQRRYDFHNATGQGRGLVVIKRDAVGHDTSVQYDLYKLLPIELTDPVSLTTKAIYDYRVLQPSEVTDANSNQTVVTFTPLGFLKSTSVKGKAGEGDQKRPSVKMEYNFLAFENSAVDLREPIFVRTVRQEHHDTEADVLLPERDATIESVEYSDGFGRLLQTRAQAEDVMFGDPVFGDAGLPADQSLPLGAAVGRQRATDPQNVVVSGWQIYDNKGRVVEKYEPFFSTGWNYAAPSDVERGQKIEMYYDPRGHVIRTVNPDRSEQLVVQGVPGTIAVPDLENPQVFEPTPWEAYTYDANDNAGRTHPRTSAGYQHHWNTPASIVVDTLGRTIVTSERNRTRLPDTSWSSIEEYRTRSSYDIRGNLLTVTDALDRIAFKHVYDLANHPLRIESIDAGIRRSVVDALGNVIEHRDSKGALILHSYDVLNRPVRLSARDDRSSAVTLREWLEYGDGSVPNQPAAERNANRVANRLGKLYRHYDEAGRLTFERYDFKGNAVDKLREVIRDAVILSVFNRHTANWRYRLFAWIGPRLTEAHWKLAPEICWTQPPIAPRSLMMR